MGPHQNARPHCIEKLALIDYLILTGMHNQTLHQPFPTTLGPPRASDGTAKPYYKNGKDQHNQFNSPCTTKPWLFLLKKNHNSKLDHLTDINHDQVTYNSLTRGHSHCPMQSRYRNETTLSYGKPHCSNLNMNLLKLNNLTEMHHTTLQPQLRRTTHYHHLNHPIHTIATQTNCIKQQTVTTDLISSRPMQPLPPPPPPNRP